MEDLAMAFEGQPIRTFAAGEVLIEEGSDAKALFVLIDGDVSIARNDQPIATVGSPGAVFGEISVLLHLPASAQVTAIGPVSAYEIEAPGALMAEYPEVLIHVSRVLARRLAEATAYVAELGANASGQSEYFNHVESVLEGLLEQQYRWDREGQPKKP